MVAEKNREVVMPINDVQQALQKMGMRVFIMDLLDKAKSEVNQDTTAYLQAAIAIVANKVFFFCYLGEDEEWHIAQGSILELKFDEEQYAFRFSTEDLNKPVPAQNIRYFRAKLGVK